jgi:hypothetical protein
MILETDEIFKHILAECENDKRFTKLQEYQNIMTKYDEEIKDRTTAYQEDILRLHAEKVKTIKFCKRIMSEAQVEAEEKSIALTDAYKKEYIMLRAQLEDDKEKFDWRTAQQMMMEKNDKLEEDLMAVEMRLVENLAEAMSKFQAQVQGINDTMETKTTDYFAYATGQNESYRQEL